jgi:hypothetical protein
MIKQNTVAGLVVMVAALISCVAASAQQQNQSGSSGQVTQGTTASSGQQAQQPAAPAAVPGGPVTGLFSGFLNNVEEGRSMLQYGISASESADSNPTGVPNSSSVLAMTSISGHVSIDRVGPRSDLTLQVSGGGLLYDTMSRDDAGMAGLSIGDSIQFRRWTLLLSDQFYYLPQTPFGFTGGLLGGLGFGSLGVTSPTPLESPNNPIFSLQTQQLSNTALAQANITTSARTTWTASVAYNITDYTGTGFLPAASYTAGAGYNYQLTSRDTIGASFTASIYSYGLGTNSLDDYVALFTYGHRFSDRLAIQLSGGPNDYDYAVPGQSSRTSQLTYAVNGGVSYLLGKSSLQLSASRGTFGGAGFLYGGTLTTVQGSASREITRFWQILGAVGYADSVGLAGTPTAGGTYRSLFATASASRAINPNVSVFLQAVFSHQEVSGPTCVSGIPCASPFNQYLASAGINWNFRARPLD